MRSVRRPSLLRRAVGLLLTGAVVTACAASAADAPSTTTTTTTSPTTTSTTSTTTTTTNTIRRTTTSSSSTSTSSTSSTTTTSSTSTTTTTVDPVLTAPPETAGPDAVDAAAGTAALPPPPMVAPPAAGVPLPALDHDFESLRGGNLAVSITVLRDGAPIYRRAGGTTVGGEQVTTATPLVLASVSKLITSLTVARLVEQHTIDLGVPMPWAAMGIAHDPAWDTVTPRELLGHTAGMPVAGNSWFDDPGSCLVPLQEAMATPPRATRGKWVYSNGNYCALGLLAEHVGGLPRDVLARQLALDALTTHGAHLTTDVPAPTDGPYAKGVARLERLGGAGTWMASTDTMAEMLAAVTTADQLTMAYPAVMVDQYGWGHTGTVDGAKACAWRLEGGRTEIVAVVAGNRPSSGGRLCDQLLPALSTDLGQADLGKPHRLPD